MQLQHILTALTSLTTVKAISVLEPFDGPLVIGQNYTVGWLQDATLKVELLLVKKDGDGWIQIKQIFDNVTYKPIDNSYNVVVDETYPTGSGYAFWLGSNPVVPDHTGYGDLTDYFDILPAGSTK